MEYKKVYDMFYSFNKKYFWGKLNQVKLNWSKKMTLCAGKTYCREKQGLFSCSIYLSEALLSQRPPQDTINTLLHEMIHAYLFLTEGGNHKMGHGPQFREHMTRINKLQGSKITVFHNFHKEVDKFRVHVYRCDGPCTKRRPYFGVLRRAIARPPGPSDTWWAKHSQECGGTYHKVEGPDITPDTARNTHKTVKGNPPSSASSPSPKYTPSPRAMASPLGQSSRAAVRDTTSDGNNLLHGVRKRLPFSQEKNTNESTIVLEDVVEEIKKRHADPRYSILLSKHKKKKRRRGPSPEEGTSVEGRVNYNYKIRSGIKFDIHKYLERYKAVKKGEARLSQKNEVFLSPHASTSTSRRKDTTKVPSQTPLDDITCIGTFKTSGSSHATVSPCVTCWNCGVNVLVPQDRQHSQKAQKEEILNDTPEIIPHGSKDNLKDNVPPSLVPCPSCGDNIPQNEINSHLDECLSPFTDDF